MIVSNKLSSFPIISLGLVSIRSRFSGSCFKNASTPVTINNVMNEKIIRFNNRLKLPFLNSFSFFTYLAKSP